MQKSEITEKLYGLIPSQQSMYVMLKYSIHKSVVQIPTSVTFDAEIDFEILKKALNREIERNDCMRLRFIKEKDGVQQYFIPEYRLNDVEVKTFSSKEEQEAFFNEDAQKAIKIFKDETFRIYFFNSFDGKKGVYLNVSHLAMDAAAVSIFYMDLISVYAAMVKNEDMPKPLYSYENYIQQEFIRLADKEKYDKDAAFYKEFFTKDGEPFYAGVHGHDLLDKARKKKKDPNLRIPAAYDQLHDKADLINRKIEPEQAKKIFDFCIKNHVSPETVLQLGYRAHVSKINYRTEDTLSLQLCSRRVTFKEKKMGGCLTQPLQVRAIIPEDYTFAQGLSKLDEVRNQLYRHMNFPYLVAYAIERKIYNLSTFEAPSFMMFTWLPLPIVQGDKSGFEFKGYNIGRYIMPLYVFTYPDTKDGGIQFNYLYRGARISEEQINALHDNCVKAVLEGIENTDITMGKLMDDIE